MHLEPNRRQSSCCTPLVKVFSRSDKSRSGGPTRQNTPPVKGSCHRGMGLVGHWNGEGKARKMVHHCEQVRVTRGSLREGPHNIVGERLPWALRQERLGQTLAGRSGLLTTLAIQTRFHPVSNISFHVSPPEMLSSSGEGLVEPIVAGDRKAVDTVKNCPAYARLDTDLAEQLRGPLTEQLFSL